MWLCGGNSRIFRTGLSHENDGDARLITKGYKLQNLAVLEFFFSNYFQIGQHVVSLHILFNILITHLKEAINAVLF